ncbi:FecR domain-containing protein [Neorhizobium sp. BT27B]|uniref:FecR family protein n=1 Tax=Neorhizobium sp. BT27B TaxID=3142625 RepID=UPI003D27B7AD
MRENTAGQELNEAYRHPDRAMDEALDWLVRLEAGGFVDRGARAEFDVWLDAEPSHRAAFEEIKTLWASPETLVAAQELDIHLRGLPVPLDAARKMPRHRIGSQAWAAAACLAVVIGATYLALQSMPRMLADYTTDAGERREITLPDGSRMILNTDSAVSLDFAGSKRGVRLIEGEVWFDVVHDATRQFHVAGHYSDVQVKGTAFVVKVQGDADTVLLQRGAVDAVHEQKSISLVHLVPGEMVVASSDAMSPVEKFDDERDLGWLQGRVVIDAKPLGDALAEVGRYFDGRVMVLNRSLLDVTVSGDYRTDRAQAAIAGLAAAAGGKTTVLPGGYIIIR